jgi:hypothetical protein
MRLEPSPVVELNRAAAVAMRDGPAAGLEIIDAILERGDLGDYQPAHAARADLCRRLGKTARPEPPTNGPSPSPSKSRSSVSCGDGWQSSKNNRRVVDSEAHRATMG